MDISKKDWKLFQEKLPSWQENYMQKLVKEYAEYLNDDTKKPSERFWWMEKRIKEDSLFGMLEGIKPDKRQKISGIFAE